jgi:hypothetical protein
MRIVSVGTCANCGKGVDEREFFVEPEIRLRRPVLLWKHRRDGAAMCGTKSAATPVSGSEAPAR